jgi:hypothetical protein
MLLLFVISNPCFPTGAIFEMTDLGKTLITPQNDQLIR